VKPTEKKISDAILAIGEALHAHDIALAELRAGLLAVKTSLALYLNPSNPAAVLGQVEALETRFLKADSGFGAREAISQGIDLLKMSEKHGGSKEA
jgi:hypothetical protein